MTFALAKCTVPSARRSGSCDTQKPRQFAARAAPSHVGLLANDLLLYEVPSSNKSNNKQGSLWLSYLLEKLRALASCVPGCWYARNSPGKQEGKSCINSKNANKTSLEFAPLFLPTLPLTKLPLVLVICQIVMPS